MKSTLISAENAIEAWRQGTQTLLSNEGELFNLITVIENPCAFEPAWLERYSPNAFRRSNAKADRLSDVVNTIFPYKLARTTDSRAELYAKYLTRHDRASKWGSNRSAWGTYFERLIRFPPNGVNQLERAIEKINTWHQRNTTGLVFHLSSPSVDAPRTRGGPCWHFGEILWNSDGTLDLVVVYRNHDFFNKVAGNFIGLGHLLQFICIASGKSPGCLTCHSVHAYYDSSKTEISAMVNA
jgi:thymidylate synthase